MYAAPLKGEKRLLDTTKCYFYSEWRRTGVVSVEEEEDE
jgi:hypothetical protein